MDKKLIMWKNKNFQKVAVAFVVFTMFYGAAKLLLHLTWPQDPSYYNVRDWNNEWGLLNLMLILGELISGLIFLYLTIKIMLETNKPSA